MRGWIWWVIYSFLCLSASGQKRWDGGAGTDAWTDEQNWHPDGVPTLTDTIYLDDFQVAGHYVVRLPAGNGKAEGYSLTIRPAQNQTITLELPVSSTAVPALQLLDPTESLIINEGGIFIHASGALSGNPIQLSGKLRINNEGIYIHRTPRGNADLTTRLSSAAGTEKGIFMYDVPGTAGYTVSLSGKTFGTLLFSATSAGTSKSYQAGGSSPLLINGELIVQSGVRFSSSLTADIRLKGNLVSDGLVIFSPASTGTVGRSVLFESPQGQWRGSGKVETGQWFRQYRIEPQARIDLDMPVVLSSPAHQFNVAGFLNLQTKASLSGTGCFNVYDQAFLRINQENGLCRTCPNSVIQTDTIRLSPSASYWFSGLQPQQAGPDLPDTVQRLVVDNPGGLTLSKSIHLKDSLVLLQGILHLDTTFRLSVRAPFISLPAADKTGWFNGVLRINMNDTARRLFPLGSVSRYAPLILKVHNPGESFAELRFVETSADNADQWSYWQIQPTDTLVKWSAGLIPYEYVQNSSTGIFNFWYKNSADWQVINAQAKEWLNWQFFEPEQPFSGVSQQTLRQVQPVLLNAVTFNLKGLVTKGEANLFAEGNSNEPVYVLKSYDGRNFELRDSFYLKGFIRWKEKINQPVVYYQLMVRMPAGNKYSNLLRLSEPIFETWKLYPNPATHKIFIFSADPCSIRKIVIVHYSGKIVRNIISNSEYLDISDLSTGLYTVRITGCGKTSLLHFTKF